MSIYEIVITMEVITMIFAAACMVGAVLHRGAECQKLTILFSFTVFMMCVGALGKNYKADTELMIYATKIEYIGAANALAVFILLYAAFLKIKIPRPVRIIMIMMGLFMTVIAGTIGMNGLYYRSYHAVVTDGVPVLVKEYGPLHMVYYIMVGVYFVIVFVMLIGQRVREKRGDRYSALLGASAIILILSYVAEKTMHIKFDIVPEGLLLNVFIMVYLVKKNFYDLNSLALDEIFVNSRDAYIVTDPGSRYVISNRLAQEMFPDIGRVSEGGMIDEQTAKDTGLRLPSNVPDDTVYQYKDRTYKSSHDEIKSAGRVIGIMQVFRDNTLEMQHTRLLETYKGELERDVEDKTLQLQQVYDQMLLGFASLVEGRNNVTGGHIKRTSAYAGAIAGRLMVSEKYKNTVDREYVSRMERIAPLHDIGKVSISDSIIDKPGKLTKEEFDEMKTHTVRGAEIIDRIMDNSVDTEDYIMARKVALYHHEKWDGKGYPEQLSGEDIPLCARIMAIADVYDALVSKRPYKEAYTTEKAFAIMQ